MTQFQINKSIFHALRHVSSFRFVFILAIFVALIGTDYVLTHADYGNTGNSNMIGTKSLNWGIKTGLLENAWAQPHGSNQVSGVGFLIYMQDTNATDGYGTYSGRQVNAENVTGTSSLVGKNIDTIILHLRKTGSPTGTATIGVFNKDDRSAKQVFGTIDVSTISTLYKNYTFSVSSSSPYYTIQSGDLIGIKYSGGDISNFVQVTADKNNRFDGTNSYFTFYTTTWGSLTSSDLTMTLELVNSTRVAPPLATIYMQDTAVTDGYGTYSGRQVNAENVTGTSSLVGKNIDTIILHLRKTGSPTGTATIGVFNKDDRSAKQVFGTIDVTTISTSNTDYTFSLPSSSPYYTVQAYDLIGIKYSGGDSSNLVQATADKNNGFNGTSSYYTFYTTTWGSLTSSDLTMTLELVNSTRVAPTIYMQDTVMTDGFGTYSLRQINAEYVDISSELVDKQIDTMMLKLKKTGSPTGNATIGIFNSDLLIWQVFGTIDVSKISTSYANYIFSLPIGETYKIEAGDMIGIMYIGGDKSNFVTTTTDRTNGFDGINSYYTSYGTSAFGYRWADSTTSDLTMTLGLVNTKLALETPTPKIYLLGSNPVTVQQGYAYADAGAIATDDLFNDISKSIIVTNPVNTSVVATYSVIYHVTDNEGNTAAQVIRTVNVIAGISNSSSGDKVR